MKILPSGRTVAVSGKISELYAAVLRSYFEREFDWSTVKKDMLTDKEIQALAIAKEVSAKKDRWSTPGWDELQHSYGSYKTEIDSLTAKGLLMFNRGEYDQMSGWRVNYYTLTALGLKAYETLKKQGRIK